MRMRNNHIITSSEKRWRWSVASTLGRGGRGGGGAASDASLGESAAGAYLGGSGVELWTVRIDIGKEPYHYRDIHIHIDILAYRYVSHILNIQVVEFQECSTHARQDATGMCLYMDIATYV